MALLLEEGRLASVDHLLGSLWDDPPDSARTNLRLHIARLRSQLALASLRDRLTTYRGGGGAYRLLVDSDEVDVARFKKLAALGFAELRSGSLTTAETILERALSLWQGPVGQGCTSSQKLRYRFLAFDELRITMRDRLVAARLDMGRTTDLIPEIHEILAIAPYREAAWAHLIRAYYLGGDIAGAISAWDRATATLGDELGLDVSPGLRHLHVSVLRRDDVAVRRYVDCLRSAGDIGVQAAPHGARGREIRP
ncbi:AfsR/SARP family transcriptional regulator [Sphaerisporangium album]|uniref:AfsR/SARP family transcriptional regulator n=1 Tax=Sphaerisporangium album TaxID=509200 RepID=UPI0015F0CE1D|nr:AfsR/SARP family transcriptional regulator [Sphaerisporangium album]